MAARRRGRGGGEGFEAALRASLVGLFALLGCACAETHVRGDDASIPDAAEPVDARPCHPGEPCDCRATSLLPAGTHWVGVDFVQNYVGPAHRVTLTRDVWIGTYEGSAGCYRRCFLEGACSEPEERYINYDRWDRPHDYWMDPAFADDPIAWLSPTEAEAYCAWLGGRLPTNAEYEKLIRGEDGRSLPWLPAPDDPRLPPEPGWEAYRGYAHQPSDPYSRRRSLVPIDAYPEGRSPYGPYNVVGNVLEWVADDFLEFPGEGRMNLYPGGDETDPLMTGSSNRLARSVYGYGWKVWDEEHLPAELEPPGVRCAFDEEPEMLAR